MSCVNVLALSEQKNDVNVIREHTAEEIISLFNQCFKVSEETELIGYFPEPEYVPKQLRNYSDPKSEQLNAIHFTKDYFASALHEISHWCIAGKERRKQLDYGYWYCPDGRNEEQQALFEVVEVKPQALEWLFAEAANFPFRLSFDNLNGSPGNAKKFADQVYQQAHEYIKNGVNERSKTLIEALLKRYRAGQPLDSHWFIRSKLGYLE